MFQHSIQRDRLVVSHLMIWMILFVFFLFYQVYHILTHFQCSKSRKTCLKISLNITINSSTFSLCIWTYQVSVQANSRFFLWILWKPSPVLLWIYNHFSNMLTSFKLKIFINLVPQFSMLSTPWIWIHSPVIE